MQDDLYDLFGRKEIFWGLQEVAKDNPKLLEVDSFFDWMCRNYITAQAVGIRRFLDQDRKSHSLWHLLYELLENPKSITRAVHVRMYRKTSMGEALGHMTFDNVVGKGRACLGPAAIRTDIRSLEDASDHIRRFVNKRIAHFTKKGDLRKLPRLNDLDNALEVVDKLFHKYDLLLTGRGGDTSHATRQYDWRETLWEPWIPKGSRLRPDA